MTIRVSITRPSRTPLEIRPRVEAAASAPSAEPGRVRSAVELIAALESDVVGQAAAKRELAPLVAMHEFLGSREIVGRTPNVILAGPTGCGKTHTVQAIARLFRVPVVITDATAYVGAGIVGEQVEDTIAALVDAADGDLERAARGVIVIDEFDKLAAPSDDRDGTSQRDRRQIQKRILKLTEGGRIRVGVKNHNDRSPDRWLDTSRILVVAAGSFAGFGDADWSGAGDEASRLTPAALVAGGLIPELVGRFPIVIRFEPLTALDLEAILVHERESPLVPWRLYFDVVLDAEIRLEPSARRLIAERAALLGLGARGLQAIVFPALARKATGVVRRQHRQAVTLTAADFASGLAFSRTPAAVSPRLSN